MPSFATGAINAEQIHVGPGRLWLNVCAPCPGRRLLIDVNGNPQITYWTTATVWGAGQEIVDSNGNIQECIVSGTGGAGQPTWGTVLYSQVQDGTALWELRALGPTYTFAGSSRGAATIPISPKNMPIPTDQTTAPVDAVMTAEVESVEVELLESDFYKLQNYITQGTYGTGTDTGLPTGVQSYEEIAFGGVRTVPKMAVALISPRRDVISKYVVIVLYRAVQMDAIQLPFTREKETLYKVKFEGLWDDYRPVGDKVGSMYRQL
jgi:hypothetical protein